MLSMLVAEVPAPRIGTRVKNGSVSLPILLLISANSANALVKIVDNAPWLVSGLVEK